MQHCGDAWGLVLGHRAGWTLVYSGDSRPCPALQRAGAGCTLLIHEATFEPGLQAQARTLWSEADVHAFQLRKPPSVHSCWAVSTSAQHPGPWTAAASSRICRDLTVIRPSVRRRVKCQNRDGA